MRRSFETHVSMNLVNMFDKVGIFFGEAGSLTCPMPESMRKFLASPGGSKPKIVDPEKHL